MTLEERISALEKDISVLKKQVSEKDAQITHFEKLLHNRINEFSVYLDTVNSYVSDTPR
ncbi:hypothetical protein [Enterobacter cloacae]|uniref:hypothetical protein n=1 Tax=Enterobacter cloacae TaxID=550 RepID=UPI003204D02D|nr:hypothetical protein [Enterobacteriaceae bacterium S32_ASV_15]